MIDTALMIPEERLEQITQRFQYLEAAMADGASGGDIAVLAKEYSDLKPVVDQIAEWRQHLHRNPESLYEVHKTAAFVAEIVRAGIQAISRGQVEAAMSMGLKRGQVLRLVILPQALRVIIPPLTSQMLNVTKNSSLAVAIGFPDFVSVANTTINQTGQAIEGIALIMVVYLFFSLTTSAFMNWYNKRTSLVER